MDPLADEYPWNSSYAFSENRVISAIELEGLEAVNLFSVDDNLWKAAESNPDKSVVHIYGHANPNYIRDNSPNGNKAKINSGKVLEKVLNDNGILLETKKVFIFHACRSSSVAKLISSSDEFKDKIIVAPVERLTIKIRAIKDNETGEFIRYDFIENAYLPLLDSKGELVKDKDGKVVNTTEKANFQAFKNGELIWEGKIEDIKYSSLLEYTEENKKLGSFQKDKK